ncbi:MAG: DHA2 family efflux MFS transporter permease subunit [Acidimicrobiales bacterium]
MRPGSGKPHGGWGRSGGRGPSGGWGRLLVEPRRPEAIRNRPDARWLVVATVCVGAFMGQLDASIVTQSFPTLQQDFHASLGDVQWVGLSYLLVLIALLTAVGRAADMVGRKLLYTYGFLVFVVGSALCGLSPSLPALVGFRVLQGLGAAMLQANSVAIIASAMPPHELGRGIGVQGAAQALGLALGPGVGGLLIALGGWRLIFLVNVPVGILGTILGWYLIPRSRDMADRRPFDWAGLCVFVVPAVALLLAISYGNDLGWASPRALGLFAVALVGGAAFVARELRARFPMLDMSLFARAPFSAGVASGLLSYLVLFGVLLVVPYLLEEGLHVPVGRAGLELMAMPAGLGLVAPAAGRAADRLGARPLTVAGMGLTCAVLVALALWRSSLGVFLVELALVGAGLGLFTAPNNAAIMGSAPREQSGVASGVLNMTRGLGTSLGLALTAVVFELFAGTRTLPHPMAGRGFDAAALFLAAAAAAAAALSGLRGRRGPSLVSPTPGAPPG